MAMSRRAIGPEKMERHPLVHPRSRRRGRLGILRPLGPGLVTGAADDDPSGIGTYSQLGAQFGLGMLWTVPLLLPLAAAVEELAGGPRAAGGAGLGRLHARTWRRVSGSAQEKAWLPSSRRISLARSCTWPHCLLPAQIRSISVPT